MRYPVKKAEEMTSLELAAYIDQSVLKPEFTDKEIEKYIREGVVYGCATVCVNPSSLDLAQVLTKNSRTKICVVCDFPFGMSPTEVKGWQAQYYCQNWDIAELDLVLNYGWIRSGKWDLVKDEIEKVTRICHAHEVAIKVILETDALTEEEIKETCVCAVAARADFVKTSTGFFTGERNVGADPQLIRMMLEYCGDRIQVKGSGGIRSREHFLQLIDMGIDRMGIGYKSTPKVLGIV